MKIRFIRGINKGEIADVVAFMNNYRLNFEFRFSDNSKNYTSSFDMETFLCDEKGEFELWTN